MTFPNAPSAVRGGLILALAAGFAAAQTPATTFSIDYKAQTISDLDGGSLVAITEGDILRPTRPHGIPRVAPVGTPTIYISSGPSGLRLLGDTGGRGHPEGVHAALEVDGLSYGFDGPVQDVPPPGTFWFSVDKLSFGIQNPNPAIVPEVWTEGPDPAGPNGMEACGDLFLDLGMPSPPVCPTAGYIGNVGAIDGNGAPGASGFAYPGLGLIEPNPMVQSMPPADDGDNLDAADLDELGLNVPGGLVYFSLDATFNAPTGLGSAAANGFAGGDVLTTVPGSGVINLFAAAPQLGLDLVTGVPDTDDLDALAVWENGNGVFDPSMSPFDWLSGGHDMVLFSVRPGSPVVGMPASNCGGAPIEPGDILTTPIAGSAISPYPAIFVAAEALGLRTFRTHFFEGDDLDALDVLIAPFFDCEGNGVEDALDILFGGLADSNANGVPDGCGFTYCTAKTNSDGCLPFLSTSGLASVTNPNPYRVVGNDMVVGQAGFFIYGSKKANLNFFGGKLCVKSPFRRWYPPKVASSVTSYTCPTKSQTGRILRNFNTYIQSGTDPFLTAGRVVTMQLWQRDPNDPFGVGLTDGLRFEIQP